MAYTLNRSARTDVTKLDSVRTDYKPTSYDDMAEVGDLLVALVIYVPWTVGAIWIIEQIVTALV